MFSQKIASVNNALGAIAWHTIFYVESYQISVPAWLHINIADTYCQAIAPKALFTLANFCKNMLF